MEQPIPTSVPLRPSNDPSAPLKMASGSPAGGRELENALDAAENAARPRRQHRRTDALMFAGLLALTAVLAVVLWAVLAGR